MGRMDWYQQSFVEHEVLEIGLRIGVVPASDHVQVVAEVYEPRTAVLLGQWSIHHGPLRDMRRTIHECLLHAVEFVEANVSPF